MRIGTRTTNEALRASGRGRHAVLLVSALTLLVLSLGAFTFSDLIAETWYRVRLGSADARTSEHAALKLVELRSTRAVPELIRAGHRHAYLETLVFLMEDEYRGEEYAAALPELMEVLEKDNPFEWMAVLKILKSMGLEAAPAVPRLVEGFDVWKLSPDFSIHYDILEILADLGPQAAEARPMLEKALGDYDQEVQRLARVALEKLGSGQ